MLRRTCQARTERGEPCRQAPLRDHDFRFWHDPENAEAATEARRLGGVRRRRESVLRGTYEVESLGSVPEPPAVSWRWPRWTRSPSTTPSPGCGR